MGCQQILFTSSLLLSSTLCFAIEPPYVSAQLALSKPAQADTALSAIMAAGIPVPNQRNIFLEAQLSSTLVASKRRSMALTYSCFGGYGVYRRLINENVALHGKAGLLYQYSKTEHAKSQGGVAGGAGIGVTVRYGRNTHYLVELSVIEGELDMVAVSAGIRYQFR